MQVMERNPLRSILLALCVPLVIAALLLVRDVTARLSDTEVRHGVHVAALVLAVDGDRASVRIPNSEGAVVTTITRHGDYAAGDTVRVVYDVVDPRRASELDAPAPAAPLTRALVAVGLSAIALAVGWMYLRRRPEEPEAEEAVRRDVVRGGRERQPQLAR